MQTGPSVLPWEDSELLVSSDVYVGCVSLLRWASWETPVTSSLKLLFHSPDLVTLPEILFFLLFLVLSAFLDIFDCYLSSRLFCGVSSVGELIQCVSLVRH